VTDLRFFSEDLPLRADLRPIWNIESLLEGKPAMRSEGGDMNTNCHDHLASLNAWQMGAHLMASKCGDSNDIVNDNTIQTAI
jgi:hypothetical protein